MSDNDAAETPSPELILKWKLGKLYDWTAPEVVETVGPYDPHAFDTYAHRLSAVRESVRRRIAEFSPDELREHFAFNGAPLRTSNLEEWEKLEADELLKLTKYPPQWFAAGLGNKDYKIDYDYWRTMPSLTLHETLCIVLGVDPGWLSERRIKLMLQAKDELHPVMKYVLAQREVLRRKFDPADHDWSVNPQELRKWVQAMQIKTPPDFLRYIGVANDQAGDAKEADIGARFDSREKLALAKLVAAMAIDGYGYTPGSLKSPIPKEIEDICVRLGLELTAETIRKYIRLGESQLPEGWNDD